MTPRFGVNYVPSRNWWYAWVDWDSRSIREDLTVIASLGLDHIRIHCIWSYFQPNASYVSSAMLDRTYELLEIADEYGLDVEIAVLDGWLSGFSFFPAWKGAKNLFTDRGMIEAEKSFFRALAERVGNHRRFMGFDLGNELGVLMGQNPATPEEADAWQSEMLTCCSEAAPGKMHVNGVDHVHWFADRGFTPNALANEGAVTSLHTWVGFTGTLNLYKPLDVGSVHLPEFCIELARAYQEDPSRQVWVQEFGMATEWLDEKHVPDFADRTIRAICRCANVWGLTWWCSHDVDRNLSGFAEMEYDLGLITVDNRVKPVGERIAALIKEFKSQPPAVPKRDHAVVFPADRKTWVKGEDLPSPTWRYGKKFMHMIEEGVAPAIVLDSKCLDEAYLKSRGITHLHYAE